MYVEKSGDHFVRHYMIDFGETLGAHGAEKNRLEDGYEHLWDWEQQPRAMLSLGLWKRPWEDDRPSPWLSVAPFPSATFDPRGWHEAYPYFPFMEMDAADAYWGAKIVARFNRSLLEAIVTEGKLSDAGASRYLVDTLVARQRKIAATWLEAVTPLDHFTIDEHSLCATDLGVHHGLASYGSTVSALDGDGFVRARFTEDREGHVCLPIPPNDQYTVYRLRIERGHEQKPPMQIHFKGGSRPHILGIVRVERT
jgi:hypothetical protein